MAGHFEELIVCVATYILRVVVEFSIPGNDGKAWYDISIVSPGVSVTRAWLGSLSLGIVFSD